MGYDLDCNIWAAGFRCKVSRWAAHSTTQLLGFPSLNLYDFQRTGVDFLKGKARAYLADTMGLGKTVQAAVAAKELGSRNTLVVAPASALENWKREWEEWGPSENTRLEVISYGMFEKVRRRNPSFLLSDLLIIDEAQYCKTHTAQRTVAALHLAQEAPVSWLLSGTPMLNHPGELYAPIAALWPGVLRQLGLRNHDEWFNFFCKWRTTQYGKRVYGVKNGELLRPFLDRIMLRRKVSDVALDLPPLRVTLHRLTRDDAFASQITGEETATQRRLLGEYKAPFIAALVKQELEDGEYDKVVIGAHHRDTLACFNKALAKFEPIGFDGTTPVAKRQPMIDAFTNDPTRRIFIVQQTAGGVAINLQAAPEIILAEPDWVPDVNAQFIKRIHRIGQNKPCRARIFTVPGTLDDSVMSGLARKIQMKVELGLK